jgi:hypothetical protein
LTKRFFSFTLYSEPKKQMEILIKSVRKERGMQTYRVKLAYRTAKGITKEFSLVRPDRVSAERELAFRIAGLNNGGKH